MREGAHGKAMKKSAALATEIMTYTYESDEFPFWKVAKEILKQGKVLKYAEK
ncbi:MAG: hypothetical protein ACI976_000943 [Aureispira sp.]|jgi:hypothetical protein